MRAALDDSSLIQNQNQIGFADGAQAVRDDESRSAAQQNLQALFANAFR